MAANYPDSIASLTNPNATDYQNVPSHSEIETQQNLEIIALETELGLGIKGTLPNLADRLNVNINLDGTLKTDINSGVINRSDDIITSIVSGTKTKTYTRNSLGYVVSMNDGTNTWTYVRDSNNNITSWSVV